MSDEDHKALRIAHCLLGSTATFKDGKDHQVVACMLCQVVKFAWMGGSQMLFTDTHWSWVSATSFAISLPSVSMLDFSLLLL